MPDFDIVMMTTAHPAMDVRIFHREARTLTEAGLRVCIVGRNDKSENVDGVWIEALPRYRNRLHRLRLGWSAFQAGLKLGGKLFIFHDPELFWVALLLSFSRHKVVYDCHENLPSQVLQKDWIPGFLRRVLAPMVWVGEWLASRLISGVIVARDAVQPRFPPSRTVLVRNFPTASTLQKLGTGAPVESRQNVVIYAGLLSANRGIRELIAAFSSPGLANAELVLAGEFSDPRFQSETLDSLPFNVRWVGQRSYADVLTLYKRAKVGALLLYPTPSHRYSLPVKLYEYLGAGLPVIASDFPEFADVVEGCGLQVDPLNVDQVRRKLQELLSMPPSQIAGMSTIARNRVLSSLTWEPEGVRLKSFCTRLLREAQPASAGTVKTHKR